MAITIDGKIFRNIQEQVEKNKRDIAAWSSIQFTLNNFGITVLGRVDTEADIPEATYEYGDAYLVGEEDPYDIYIFTRDGADGEFINMGPLTVVGPEGPAGSQGPAGTITVGSVTTGEPGTSVIVTNSGTAENAIFNFTIPKGATGSTGSQGEAGPVGQTGLTGPEGPQGPQGDPGESFMIIGTITNTSQLPDPSDTPRNYAYVYDDGDATTPNRLYYITGTEGNEQWSYSSLAAAGTTVTVSGNPVSTWSADTKIDEPSTAGTNGQVLTIGSGGSPEWATPAAGGGDSTTAVFTFSNLQTNLQNIQNEKGTLLTIKAVYLYASSSSHTQSVNTVTTTIATDGTISTGTGTQTIINGSNYTPKELRFELVGVDHQNIGTASESYSLTFINKKSAQNTSNSTVWEDSFSISCSVNTSGTVTVNGGYLGYQRIQKTSGGIVFTTADSLQNPTNSARLKLVY